MVVDGNPTPPRFILLNPSQPGNVGAAARAMKVMGYADLVLVAPRHDDVLERPEAVAFASGAIDVLQGARIVASFDDAIDGVDHLCATAMTARDFGPPTSAPRPLFAALASTHRRMAFVFGGERHGMRNEDVYRCHAVLRIPTHGGDASLNLGQAVQLIAYEWRLACDAMGPLQHAAPHARPADAVMVRRVIHDWAHTLEQLSFFDPAVPRKLLPRLQRLLNRSVLTDDEAHILLGISRAARDGAAQGPISRNAPIDK